MLAPSSMSMATEDLDEQFYALASDEDVTDIDELNKVCSGQSDCAPSSALTTA